MAVRPDDRNLRMGLFDRVASIFKLVHKIPEVMSDEEVEGILKVLPPDSRSP